MRIGIFAGVGELAVDEKLRQFEKAEAAGFSSAWIPGIHSHEAMMMAALAGQRTSRIEIGTFVLPTYPRHPIVMAQQALTASAASGGRFVLGVGLSHRVVIEDAYGLDFSKPIGHMREYLSVLNGLLDGVAVNFKGTDYSVASQLALPGASRPAVVVAALQPKMLRLAGELADGTAIWMGGRRYLEETAVPLITDAANAAGRPAPRIIAGFPVAVTHEVEAARLAAHEQFKGYADIPSYGAILEMARMQPADIAVVGTEDQVDDRLTELAAVGVTDFNAFPLPIDSDPDSRSRTIAYLSARSRESGA